MGKRARGSDRPLVVSGDGLERGGERGVLGLRSGVIHLHWDSGPIVTEDAALELMGRVSTLCNGRRRPLLVTTDWLEALECKARNVFAARWPLTRVAVVGTSPVDEVIFVFYAARHGPLCPTQFFTSEEEARKWLKTPARAGKYTSSTGGTRG